MNTDGNVQLGVYRHNKSGKLYKVIGSALHTESSELLVLYKPLYKSEYKCFARPLAMFTEQVEINGIQAPRFEKTD